MVDLTIKKANDKQIEEQQQLERYCYLRSPWALEVFVRMPVSRKVLYLDARTNASTPHENSLYTTFVAELLSVAVPCSDSSLNGGKSFKVSTSKAQVTCLSLESKKETCVSHSEPQGSTAVQIGCICVATA